MFTTVCHSIFLSGSFFTCLAIDNISYILPQTKEIYKFNFNFPLDSKGFYDSFKKTPAKLGDELNLICHPPLEVTKGNPTLRGGEDVIRGDLRFVQELRGEIAKVKSYLAFTS